MKLLTIFVMLAASFALCFQSASAFDLFNNCTTEADGTKVCGPCKTNPNTPSCVQASQQGGETTNRITGTGNIINEAANIIALITGIAAIILIIVSGLRFVTSGGAAPGQRSGDPNAIKSARSMLAAAIIGLIIVALAWTITRFITDRLIQ